MMRRLMLVGGVVVGIAITALLCVSGVALGQVHDGDMIGAPGMALGGALSGTRPTGLTPINMLAESEDFETSDWTNGGCSVGYGLWAPDGEQDAQFFYPGTGFAQLVHASMPLGESLYCVSVWVNEIADIGSDATEVRLYNQDDVSMHSIVVTYNASHVPSISSSVQIQGSGVGAEESGAQPGWYRVWFYVDLDVYGGERGDNFTVRVMPYQDSTAGAVAAWGVQLENGRTEPGPYLEKIGSRGGASDTTDPTIISFIAACVDVDVQAITIYVDEPFKYKLRAAVTTKATYPASWGNWSSYSSSYYYPLRQFYDNTVVGQSMHYHIECIVKDGAGNESAASWQHFQVGFGGACL